MTTNYNVLIRKCHCCGTLNEANVSSNFKCNKCGKSFLPADYFSKIRARAIAEGNLSEEFPEFPLNPLYGLIVFWE
jgi:tRNA(Ile2) C34 agmatinyltransferase TiaS